MSRKESIFTGEFYHVYNRGVEKRRIFLSHLDYQRFTNALFHYLVTDKKFTDVDHSTTALPEPGLDKGFIKPAELIAFCLMPNHFHFLVKQIKNKGISEYVHQVTTSYAKYFNLKNERVGPLFQGRFKAKRIDTLELLLYVSKYIHRNPIDSAKKKLTFNQNSGYPWSSLRDYALEEDSLIFKEPILANFSSKVQYLNFVKNNFADEELRSLRDIDTASDNLFGD